MHLALLRLVADEARVGGEHIDRAGHDHVLVADGADGAVVCLGDADRYPVRIRREELVDDLDTHRHELGVVNPLCGGCSGIEVLEADVPVLVLQRQVTVLLEGASVPFGEAVDSAMVIWLSVMSLRMSSTARIASGWVQAMGLLSQVLLTLRNTRLPWMARSISDWKGFMAL